MKALIKSLTIPVFLLFSLALKAEGDTKIGGVRAGYQYSTMAPSAYSIDPLSSFYVGVFKNNKIVPGLHWTAGLEYFQTGYYKNADNQRVMGTLSVPVNIKVKAGPFFFLGGFSANVKLSEEYKIGGLDGPTNANAFDLPLHGGLGFRIAIINFEARYHYGMLKVDDSGTKNQYLQLGLGVSF